MQRFIATILLAGTSLANAHAAPAASVRADLRGQYDLNDGSRLTITEHRHTLYAQLDDGPAVALSATGTATHTDRSGQLRIEFKQAANGNVSGVTVTRPARTE